MGQVSADAENNAIF
jgi:hypothetical protein